MGKNEQVPRRMKRFSREGDAGVQLTYDEGESQKEDYSGTQHHGHGFFGRQQGQEQKKGTEIPDEIFKALQDQKKSEVHKESISLAVGEIKKFREKNKRFPQGAEYDEIAENIYQQIKQQENREKQERRNQKPQAGKFRQGNRGAQAIPAQLPGRDSVAPARLVKGLDVEKLDVRDLFGEKDEKELKLEDIVSDSGDELKLGELDESLDSMPKELETEKNNCPNCKEKTEELVFCPECGTAFCAHCAKAAKTEAGITKFTCPKCSREVKAQK